MLLLNKMNCRVKKKKFTCTSREIYTERIEIYLDNSLDMLKKQQQETTVIRPRVPDNNRPMSLPPLQQTPQPIASRPYTEYPTQEDKTVRIVAEGEIDPDYLVPAQTNAGDSLAPSSSIMNTNHIPLIPAPPLLTTHRHLQAKLDDLDEKIRTCRSRKQAILQRHPS